MQAVSSGKRRWNSGSEPGKGRSARGKKAGMPLAPVLTSPWIGVEHGGAGRGLGDRARDRLRAQLDTSFQMLRNARDCGISVMSGSDTGNASAFSHGR